MGGKTKQSQRTKNNARPSSSGRSAELLHNAVNIDTSMVAGGNKLMTSLFPTLSTPTVDPSLPQEFSMCIKKLNKKDPITKVKALQELTELVTNSKVDDVELMLPSWTHFYKILTLDSDCKVREATQVCHGAVCVRAGRRLAPQLRRLVPAWLAALHDHHAPATTTAHRTLQSTFPEHKLPEVISFCKSEIMAHVTDNLLGNADKVVHKRAEGAEEAEERAVCGERRAAGALRCLRELAERLPPADEGWLAARLPALLAHAAFWHLAAHRSLLLRAAWFETVSQLVRRWPASFVEKAGARLVRLVAAAAAGAAPPQAAALWDCALHLMHALPDWHQWLDKKDLFSKRILEMLEKGGWGDAKHLTDLLLPLLAYLPKDTLTKEFYEAFFYAFFSGLRTKSVLNSKSERQYWITSLAECLRYLSIQQTDYAVEVTTSVHRLWLRTALFAEYNQIRINLIKTSATNMAALVKFWLKQAKEANGEKYDQLVRNFWQNVCASLLLQIEKPAAEDLAHIIEGHILLLQTLKTAFLSEAKKVHSIKFDDDVPKQQETKPAVCQVIDPAITERYKHNLNEVVEKVCAAYLEYADKNDVAEPILEPLITIFNEFDSKELYLALGKAFGANDIYELYDKVFGKWLQTDTMRCKAIVDIVFMLLKYLTDDEQTAVMTSFDNAGMSTRTRALQLAAAHAQWGAGGARAWLRGGGARDTLLALARAPPAPALLAALARDHRDEMLIAESTAWEIAEAAGEGALAALAATDRPQLEAAAQLAAHLATALATAHPGPGYLRLLHALLQLLLLLPRGAARVSPPLWCEVSSSVHDAAAALAPAARAAARAAAADTLREHLGRRTDKVVLSEIDHVASLCPYLLKEYNDSESPSDVTEIVEFTQQLFDFEENKSTPVEVFALQHDIITNRLNCLFEDDNDIIRAVVEDSANNEPELLTIENLVPYLNKFLFRALYLHKIFLHKVNSGDDEEEEPAKTWCDALFTNNFFKAEFCNVIREFMVTRTLEEAYGFWEHHDVIKEANSRLSTVIDEILEEASREARSDILNLVSERAIAQGYYWAFARKFLAEKVDQREVDNPTLDTTKMDDIITGNGFFHCMQVSGGSGEERARLQVALMTRSVLAAYPAAYPAAHLADPARACSHLDLDPIVHLYHGRETRLFHERHASSMPWKEVVAEASVLRALEAVLALNGWDAPQPHWDLATLALCAAFGGLRRAPPACTKAALSLCAAQALLVRVREFVAAVPAAAARRVAPAHVAALPAEWADLVAPALHAHLAHLALHALQSWSPTLSLPAARGVSAVWRALSAAEWRPAAGRRQEAGAEPEPGARQLVAAAADVLAAPAHAAYHVLAYRLLRALESDLIAADEATLSRWEEAEGEDAAEGRRLRAALAPGWLLTPTLAALQQAHRACEGATPVCAGGVEHRTLLGALLASDVVAELTAAALGDLAHQYTMAYREAEYVSLVAPLSLQLVPGWLRAGTSPPLAPAALHDWFLDAPPYHPDDGGWRGSLPRLAARALAGCAECGGGEVRALAAGGPWARLLAAHVTPALMARQARALHTHQPAMAHLHTQARVVGPLEVYAVCTAVEPRAELWLRLAPQHPLAAPSVRARSPPHPHLPAVLLTYMTHQNGSLLGCVLLWARSMVSDEDEGGVCHVCYCRRHPASGRQPELACPQCAHNYHRRCLRTWFATSQRTACPLCRTSF